MEMGRLGGSRAGKDRHYILRFSVFAFMAFVRVRGTFVHRSCSPQICIIAPSYYSACRVQLRSLLGLWTHILCYVGESRRACVATAIDLLWPSLWAIPMTRIVLLTSKTLLNHIVDYDARTCAGKGTSRDDAGLTLITAALLRSRKLAKTRSDKSRFESPSPRLNNSIITTFVFYGPRSLSRSDFTPSIALLCAYDQPFDPSNWYRFLPFQCLFCSHRAE
jgi:hypothetical protein